MYYSLFVAVHLNLTYFRRTLMKGLLVVMVLCLLALGSKLATAQDITQPSWLLYEENGDAFALEVQSSELINLTDEFEPTVAWPQWSVDGELISFIITEDLPHSYQEVPFGVAAWMQFGAGQTVHTVPLCERADRVCTDASISGEWMVLTAIRVSDGFPMLYAFNLSTEETVLLATEGDFRVGLVENGWSRRGETYIVYGKFGTVRDLSRTFEVPGPGFTTDQFPGEPGIAYLGCNFESVQSFSGRLEVRSYDANFEPLRIENVYLGPSVPWRNCRAE